MTEEKKEIENLLKDYESALNTGDTDSSMKLFGANPILIIQNSPATIGRVAVRTQTAGTFKAIKFDVHFSLHEFETQGDIAWARTSHPKGNQLWILHREDGKWKVHRYMAAANSPPLQER